MSRLSRRWRSRGCGGEPLKEFAHSAFGDGLFNLTPPIPDVIVATCFPISLATLANFLAADGRFCSPDYAPAIDHKARANTSTLIRSLATIAAGFVRRLGDGRRDPWQHFESKQDIDGDILISEGGEVGKEFLEEQQ
jgi:hypothetical protein